MGVSGARRDGAGVRSETSHSAARPGTDRSYGPPGITYVPCNGAETAGAPAIDPPNGPPSSSGDPRHALFGRCPPVGEAASSSGARGGADLRAGPHWTHGSRRAGSCRMAAWRGRSVTSGRSSRAGRPGGRPTPRPGSGSAPPSPAVPPRSVVPVFRHRLPVRSFLPDYCPGPSSPALRPRSLVDGGWTTSGTIHRTSSRRLGVVSSERGRFGSGRAAVHRQTSVGRGCDRRTPPTPLATQRPFGSLAGRPVGSRAHSISRSWEGVTTSTSFVLT